MEDWFTAYRIPLGKWIEAVVDALNTHAAWLFNAIAFFVGTVVDGLTDGLMLLPPLVTILALAALAYGLQRSWMLAAGVILSLLLIVNMGYWEETVETLALVVFATFVCMLLGVPIGIAAARRPWLYKGSSSDPRSYADIADFCVPHPDADSLRPWRGAGIDLDGDLCDSRVDPADAFGHIKRSHALD